VERPEHYRQRYGFRLFACILMSNHVHLLLETKSMPLSKIMQGIQFRYTQSFNRRRRKVGHLSKRSRSERMTRITAARDRQPILV
jgi:REP element-mobilizing transposase RayT